jgi:hypothetical protein
LDLRNLASGISFFTQQNPASYIAPPTIERIFETAKREVWLNLFTGGRVAQAVLNPANVAPQNRVIMDYFDAWANDDISTAPGNHTANNKNSKDYVIAERIVRGGYIYPQQDLSAAGYSPFFIAHLLGDGNIGVEAFDILGVNAYFTYAQEDGKYDTHFNALDDIPGYSRFMDIAAVDSGGTPLLGTERFIEFDQTLGDEMRGVPTDKSQGSPLAPRLPALVSPRFWIMSEGATANDPPFKHYFDQVVEVPSSTGRKLPKQFVPNAG